MKNTHTQTNQNTTKVMRSLKTRNEVTWLLGLNTLFLLGTLIFISLLLGGCGQVSLHSKAVAPQDDAVVRGRAVVTVVEGAQNASLKSQSAAVTYLNATSTQFSVDASALVAGAVESDILDLGNFAVNALNDNDLKVCGTNGKTKCTRAAIRVYTLGALAGFINSDGNYGVPVFAGSLNANTEVGNSAASAVLVQSITIPSSKNRVILNDFTQTKFNVSADFKNAGAGTYSMTWIMEYVLMN